MIGELTVSATHTTMTHGGVVFGTTSCQGHPDNIWCTWRTHIPSLSLVFVEKSRVLAEQQLIDTYCAQEVETLDRVSLAASF